MRKIGWGLLVLAVVSCGRRGAELQSSQIPVPAHLTLTGKWGESPAVHQKTLGESRLTQLSVTATVQPDAEVPGLVEGIYLDRNSGWEWVAPAAGDCKLSQVQVRRPEHWVLQFQIWGWDTETPACQLLLERAQSEGFQMALNNVGVRNGGVISRVDIRVGR